MKLPRTSKHCSVPRICTKVEADSEIGKRCLLFHDTRYAAGWIKRASLREGVSRAGLCRLALRIGSRRLCLS